MLLLKLWRENVTEPIQKKEENGRQKKEILKSVLYNTKVYFRKICLKLIMQITNLMIFILNKSQFDYPKHSLQHNTQK